MTIKVPWRRQLDRYQWLVFLVASLAWLFDCLDQRVFTLARAPALRSLLPAETTAGVLQAKGKEVTAIFLLGWGAGGVIFGALGDRHGRARMLTTTVLIYSTFTGLTFLSESYASFAAFRFLTGLGVGGVFGLAAALIAETAPDEARAPALGMLQILSAVGNISAALLMRLFDALQERQVVDEGWRWMFLVGAAPAVLFCCTARFLREPEPWQRMKAEGRLPSGGLLAPYRLLLAEKPLRRRLAVGVVLASAGVIGLWAIGEYAVDLQRVVFTKTLAGPNVAEEIVRQQVNSAISWSYVLNVLGAVAGMWLFTRAAIRWGRRPAFAAGFSAALIVTLLVYGTMDSPADALWMMPLMGAAQMSVFAGFAIYLPELFPSRLRSTGTSFCYNVGRFAAAGGSLVSAQLAASAFGHLGSPAMERYSAMAMCSIFCLGILALPFAPETRGRPLPE